MFEVIPGPGLDWTGQVPSKERIQTVWEEAVLLYSVM